MTSGTICSTPDDAVESSALANSGVRSCKLSIVRSLSQSKRTVVPQGGSFHGAVVSLALGPDGCAASARCSRLLRDREASSRRSGPLLLILFGPALFGALTLPLDEVRKPPEITTVRAQFDGLGEGNIRVVDPAPPRHPGNWVAAIQFTLAYVP